MGCGPADERRVPWRGGRAGIDGGAAGDAVLARGRAATAQRHDEREHAGDRGVQLRRDLLAELARGVQGAGQRDVLDHRDALLGRLLADLGGDGAGALGDDPGRARAGLVAQRDGDVRRVDQHDVGVGDLGHHPVAAHRQLLGADAAPLSIGSPSVRLCSSLTSFSVIRVCLRLRFITTMTSATREQQAGDDRRCAAASPCRSTRCRAGWSAGSCRTPAARAPVALIPTNSTSPTTAVLSSVLAPCHSGLHAEQPLEAVHRLELVDVQAEALAGGSRPAPCRRRAVTITSDDEQRRERRRRRERSASSSTCTAALDGRVLRPRAARCASWSSGGRACRG